MRGKAVARVPRAVECDCGVGLGMRSKSQALAIEQLAAFVDEHVRHGAMTVQSIDGETFRLTNPALGTFAAFVEGARAESWRRSPAEMVSGPERDTPLPVIGAAIAAVVSLTSAVWAFATRAPLMGGLFLVVGAVLVTLNLQDRGES